MGTVTTEKKPGLLERTAIYIGEVRTEMSKVVWPTKENLRTYTIVVLVSTAIISALIGVWDMVLGFLMEQLFFLA